MFASILKISGPGDQYGLHHRSTLGMGTLESEEQRFPVPATLQKTIMSNRDVAAAAEDSSWVVKFGRGLVQPVRLCVKWLKCELYSAG